MIGPGWNVNASSDPFFVSSAVMITQLAQWSLLRIKCQRNTRLPTVIVRDFFLGKDMPIIEHNYEGREFDSRTRLVVGRAAWLGPSSEGGFMRRVSEFLGRSSSGFSWSESAGAGTSSECVATMKAASSTRGPDWLWAGRRGWRGWGRVPRAGSCGEFRGSWAEVQAGFLGRSPRGRERVRSKPQQVILRTRIPSPVAVSQLLSA